MKNMLAFEMNVVWHLWQMKNNNNNYLLTNPCKKETSSGRKTDRQIKLDNEQMQAGTEWWTRDELGEKEGSNQRMALK